MSSGEPAKRAPALIGGEVPRSIEFERIVALPRRDLDLAKVEDVTPLFHKKGGRLFFWPIQSAALIEAAWADGLFASMGCGSGKTLVCLALPEALDSKQTVLLVKPDLKRQLVREIDEFYLKHFNLPIDRIRIVSYSELSSAKKAMILEETKPDLIVADEAHCLRHATSARTKRFLRYMKAHPHCRFAALSGTMTKRSLKDFAHLIELALRKNSPVPGDYYELRDWCGAIDVEPEVYMNPGALRLFCKPGETVREGFYRRLAETRGVVTTPNDLIGTSLVVRKLYPRVPSKLHKFMQETRKQWKLGDEEFASALDRSKALKQLACGFYYQWVWPNNEPDFEWLDARKNWHREVREKLKHAGHGMDSPLLLANAADRYLKWDADGRPRPRPKNAWDSVYWSEWKKVKTRPKPKTETVWLDEFLVDQAITWTGKQTEPAIIWCQYRAISERIAEKGGFPLYGQGTDASVAKENVIVCTISTQGTGKNLQRYSKNLIVTMPGNGTTFEQLASRTHRPGQEADEVTIEWFSHTEELEEAWAQILLDADYMQETQGSRQRALYATKIG